MHDLVLLGKPLLMMVAGFLGTLLGFIVTMCVLLPLSIWYPDVWAWAVAPPILGLLVGTLIGGRLT